MVPNFLCFVYCSLCLLSRNAAVKKSLGKKKIRQKAAREVKSQHRKMSKFDKKSVAKKQMKRSGKNNR